MDKLAVALSRWKKPVIGLGVTAFTRTGPAFLLPHFSILCSFETADLKSIRQVCPVYSLEKDFRAAKLKKQNTSSIIIQPQVYSFLKSLGPETSLSVYKSTKKVEKICQKLGIEILSNPSFIRDPFENKKEFRILAAKAGLKLPPGETLLINKLDEGKYQELVKKYGPELVFQLTDYKIGGGVGTFFVKKKADWRRFKAFVDHRRKRGKKLAWVGITKFIKGEAASISGCVTQYGVLCGLVQTQLIDVPEATIKVNRNGVWCGHDWGFRQFSRKVQEKAEKIAKTLGSFMHKKGYKGVFGLDLVIDEEREEVWPVECNSRYTGGFPVYSMMQRLYGEPSFDAFHLLEFLEIDYDLDFQKIQDLYRQPKIGAHLILSNREGKRVSVEEEVKGGVYKLKNDQLVWQKPGFSLQHLKNKDEFALVDRAAIKGRILKSGERLARVLFRDKIAANGDRLSKKASLICKKIYQRYALKPTEKR